jgi:DNA ligase (NAD+)
MVTKEQLEEYQKAYSAGHSLITDEEYDNLLEEYLNEHGGESNRPFMRNKQSSAVNDIVGSLPKLYGIEEPMRPGQKIYLDWVKSKKLDKDTEVIIQPKLDGCSVAYDFTEQRFFTRGDYDNGESLDVTDLFKHCISSNSDIKYYEKYKDIISMKFEAIMSNEEFIEKHFDEKYKRPRDAVAGIITSRNVEASKSIRLIPLRLYWNDGAQTIPHMLQVHCAFAKYDAYQHMQYFIKNLLSNNALIIYEDIAGYCGTEHFACDGVVISVTNKYKESYTTDNELITTPEINPEKEVAVKILNLVKETTLRDIEWQFGKTGRITPVAIVEPVMFDKVKVTHVGLSTFERVINMGLKCGDTVRIVYNIVPYFLDSYHDGDYPIPIPTKCPMCGADLNLKVYKQIRCTNPDCKGKRLGDIIRYAEKMKIMGLSKASITTLYDNDFITSIPDLYDIDYDALSNHIGYGKKLCYNIKRAIEDSSKDVTLEKWLGALPCLDVSEKTWRLLLNAVYDSDMEKAYHDIEISMRQDTPERFLENILWYVDGIGPATIRSINEGIRNNWEDIKRTFSFIEFKLPKKNNISKGRVAMSGIRDSYLQKELESRGYEVDTFNSKCVALVVRDKDFTSGKVSRAKELNIPIYTVQEAYDALT